MSNSLHKQNIMTISGIEKVIKNIESSNSKVQKEVTKALEKASEYPKRDMVSFMSEGKHYLTGATKESWEDLNVKWTNNKFNGAMGFDADKGGVPAVFLDVGTKYLGTPRIRPTFFIYYAQKNNETLIEMEFKKAVDSILKGLK